MNWLSYSLISLTAMGILNVVLKLAADKVDAFLTTFLTGFSAALLLLPFLIAKNKISFSSYGLVAGILWAVGVVSLNLALSKADVSRVLPIVSLGGALAAFIGMIILKEAVTPFKIVGIILSCVSIILLSI